MVNRTTALVLTVEKDTLPIVRDELRLLILDEHGTITGPTKEFLFEAYQHVLKELRVR